MSTAPAEAKRPKLASSGGLVTHSGTFHADEALAVHLLRKLPEFKEMPLTRTRDPQVINDAHIVVDVGAEYAPERRRYDHHQRGFEEVFDAEHKTKLSSAGLVWKHYGPSILSAHLSLPTSDPTIALLHAKLYDDFIEAIDGIDNGIPQYSGVPAAYKSRTDLSSRVGHLNPRWNENTSPEDQDARFEKASLLAGTEFFERVDYAVQAWLPARQVVIDALEARNTLSGDARILLFEGYASWKEHLFTLEASREHTAPGEVIYVVYPDESGKWRVQAVPESPDSFVSRKALPEEWRGVRDDKLSEVSGIEGCVFVHASGFIGGNASREGALKMAKRGLEA